MDYPRCHVEVDFRHGLRLTQNATLLKEVSKFRVQSGRTRSASSSHSDNDLFKIQKTGQFRENTEKYSPQWRSTFEKELCTDCLVCTIREAQQPGVWPVPSICPRELLCSCLAKMVPRYLSQAHFLCLYLSPRNSPLKIEVPLARSGTSLHFR